MKKKLLISVLSLLAIGFTTGCNDKNSESSKPTLPPVSENTSKPEESTEESTVKPTEEVKYTLTVHAEGIELSTLESSYKEGEEVSFSITSALPAGYLFKVTFESNELTATEGQTYKFIMPKKDAVLTVEKVFIEYHVTVESSASYSISIKDAKDSYHIGDTVGFKISLLDQEYSLSAPIVKYGETTIDTTLADGYYSFVMPASDVTISNTPTKKTYGIQEELSHVTINYVSGNREYEKGETVSFSLTVDNGYSLSNVNLKVTSLTDTSPVEITRESSTYSFVMPSGGVKIHASAKLITHAVTIEKSEHLSVSFVEAGNTGNFASNTVVQFKVESSDPGFIVDTVKVYRALADSTDFEELTVSHDDTTGIYSFTMPAIEVKIVATEKANVIADTPFSEGKTYKGIYTILDYDYEYNDYVPYDSNLTLVFHADNTLDWSTDCPDISSYNDSRKAVAYTIVADGTKSYLRFEDYGHTERNMVEIIETDGVTSLKFVKDLDSSDTKGLQTKGATLTLVA